MGLLGKSALIFAGRIHHYLRLSSVAIVLQNDGMNVRFCTADNAWNVDPSTAYLNPAGAKVLHALDYLDKTDVVDAWTSKIISSIAGHHLEDRISPFVLAYSSREAAECLYSFNGMLDVEKPDLMIVLHENNFWTKMLAYLCHIRHIPVVSFQEGMLRLRDQKTQGKQSMAAEYSDKLLTWSKFAADEYIAAGIVPEKIEVTGICHLDFGYKLIQDPDKLSQYRQWFRKRAGFVGDSPLVAFCLPQLSRYEGDPLKAVQQVAGWANARGMNLGVRFHPFESYEFVAQIKSQLETNVVKIIDWIADGVELILAADVVLSQHSSVAVESLALNVPLVELDFDHTSVLESMAQRGAAFQITDVKKLDTLVDICSGKLQLSTEVLNEWKWKMAGERDGKATERAVEVITGLL